MEKNMHTVHDTMTTKVKYPSIEISNRKERPTTQQQENNSKKSKKLFKARQKYQYEEMLT